MSTRELIIFADSLQRDTTLYPSGNSYTLHLTNPIKNVTKVDLVSAVVPNTMYNLTSMSNVFRVDTSNVFLNPGFYSMSSLVSAFNTSNQVSNVLAQMAYLPGEGRFILYGNLASVSVLTADMSRILGLPVGTTTSSLLSANKEYAGMWPSATTYVRSSSVINLSVNEYIWLDIAEFRTPLTVDARQLTKQAWGQVTTSSNTAATSFALVPMDVISGAYKSFKENSDYRISVEFPSRIDSIDRLTVTWRDRYGIPLNFNGLDVNSFGIRVHTVVVPTEPERIESVPKPVQEGMFQDRQKAFMMVSMVLVIGLVLIMLMARRTP
jgi:hypothetical protein